MKKLIDFYTRLPAFIKNKYFVSITLFLVWMLFIDDYNMVFQWQKSRELAAIKEKKEYYEKEIQQVNQDRKDLFSSKANLEKYAREKYLMKRDDEDIFVIKEN
jgi:cell division protein FtsB